MAEFNDVELLSRLSDALAAPPVRPDGATLARLHATLAELEEEVAPVDIRSVPRHGPVRQRAQRRGLRARSTVVLASAVAVALSAGVAAAAVATNTLPGPTRAFAYDLGLPVTSPPLHQAQQTESQLRGAIASHQDARARRLGQVLIGEMKNLSFSDLSQIRASADTLLVEIGVGLSTTTPSVPMSITTTVTLPASSKGASKISS